MATGTEVFKIVMKKEPVKYADRSREEWIAWAKREIEEYKKFIKFLKGLK